MLLIPMLRSIVGDGSLTVIDAAGKTHRLGVANANLGPDIHLRLHDRRLEWTLPLNPALHLGEAYTDGRLTLERGSLYDFLELCARNMHRVRNWPGVRLGTALGRIQRPLREFNYTGRSRRNVAHHYDLSGALYDLFLDSERQYSCAYFADPGESLETAQQAKMRHIAAKLRLQPGQRLLDIGSGWGGLGLYLARTGGVEVSGITLSTEQLAVAKRRAAEAGLDDRVGFRLQDYRHETGRYDRIVSVGMFEHVGRPHYRGFFEKIRDLLTDDGVAVLHAIGMKDGPGPINPWITRYIFPGSHTPALSEILPAIERAGLWVTDIEILRLHYAETLRHWRERFMARRDEARALYDERFCRMWEFYLTACEIGFRHLGNMVFQIQLTRSIDAVPLTRDYMMETERVIARRTGIAA